MRPMIRTDIHAINAIDAEQLAADREWDHTDLTYEALTQLAATAHARITATIHAIAQLRVSQSARTAMSPMSRPPVSMPIWSRYAGLGESHVAHLDDQRPGAVDGIWRLP